MKIKTRRYYFYYAGRFFGFLLCLLPIKVLSRLAASVGSLAFSILSKPRKISLENLRRVFPDKPEEEIRKIARGSFSNACRSLAEYANVCKINKKNVDLWVNAHGLEKIDKAFMKGKGVILLTAHFGNWELVGAYMRLKDYPGATIVRKIYFDKYNDYLAGLRRIHDVKVVYRDESPKKMLRFLKNNQGLGILADQDVDSIDGVFVDFFGFPAFTPKAPVKIAMASGSPIIPCYMIRKGSRYDYIVEDPIIVEKGENKEDAIKFYTQKWTSVLEKHVRKHPEQWVWMHRRWKTKPQ